ncbi:hypothetical protein BWZ20_09550 [Winogradskyella sp. J14-2]|uniref:hypothetical protein n=1 Tax=Winogradskyella sp. J14-2 TaxID=1936080 RepID=UPI0009728BB8|nr:hypothetical protein [Winogradskyella sp. J14-2]APY08529.1 hypothetical protein BWZ20_09550 [Winogradskyella sp. J14-2]
MNEKKNIDRLFQEKFKDFEVTPNDAVWNRISESLPNKKKKRRVIALWWQIGGVAAVIALLLTAGVSLFNSSDDSEVLPIIVDTEKIEDNSKKDTELKGSNDHNNSLDSGSQDINVADSNENESYKPNGNEQSLIEQNNTKELISSKTNRSKTVANSTENKTDSTSNAHQSITQLNNENNSSAIASSNERSENKKEEQIINDSEIKSVIKNTIDNKNSAVTDNTSPNDSENNSDTENNKELEKDTSVLIEDNQKESILDAIADNSNNEENIDEKEKEDEQNRWSIAPNVAPVYYSSLGQGSSIDQQFNNNSKSGNINMSYGITGSYAVTNKLKVRAGINRVNLSQSTSNVFALSGSEFASRNAEVPRGNIDVKGGFENISLMSGNMFDRNSAPEIFNSRASGNIEQRFGFIEVPLELEYRLVAKKFGVNVIGGFSTFFLNQNEVYADIDGATTLIGEANNMNTTSFSANLGLGLNYSLSKQWNFNLEPQFKYQINTFNNTSGNYRPFFIGLYTGLSYKF